MKMFELLPRPLGSIFRKLTHLTCNSPGKSAAKGDSSAKTGLLQRFSGVCPRQPTENQAYCGVPACLPPPAKT